MTRALPRRRYEATHADPWVMASRVEKAALVRPLLDEGLSYTAIAERIGADLGCYVTRAAVAGVVSRIRSEARAVLPRVRRSPDDHRQIDTSPAVPARDPCGKENGLLVSEGCGYNHPAIESVRPHHRDVPIVAPASDAPLADPPRGGGIPFHALKRRSCRFPLWPNDRSPDLDGMRFCGAETDAEGSSWCAAHRRVCCLPVKKRDARSIGIDRRAGRIRSLLADGVSVRAVADRFRVSTAYVIRVAEGEA